MKKLLGIVVLGLLLVGNAYAEIIELKCVITKMEVNGKEKNRVTGEKLMLEKEDIFEQVDINDPEALKTDLMFMWVDIAKSARKNSSDKYVTFKSINRYDLNRFEQTISVDEETAKNYKSLWEDAKKDNKILNDFGKRMMKKYLNINYRDDINDFTMSQNHDCEKIEKVF